MQCPDVNVLASAFRDDSERHDPCRAWLDSATSGRDPVGVSDLVLSGVLGVLTHRRMSFPPVASESAALVDGVPAQHAAIPLRPGLGHRRVFRRLVALRRHTGNRVPCAFHAALAIEHVCDWGTLDHGFSTYPGLRVRNLLYGCLRLRHIACDGSMSGQTRTWAAIL